MVQRFAILAATLFLAAPFTSAALFDHSDFDRMLQKYVDEDGYVDYANWRTDNASALDAYLERAADADMGGWSRAERLAFWINVYNAQVIRALLQTPDLKKVSAGFGIFNKPFNIGGARYTLNDVEFRILLHRPNPENQLKPVPYVALDPPEPRVHFVLVNGAVGSPRLQNLAYAEKNMDDALRAAAVRFSNDVKYVDIQDGRLRISAIMKWYGKDFTSVKGPAAFLASHINPDQRPDAAKLINLLGTDYGKAAFAYDWTVNDLKNKHPAGTPAPAEPLPQTDSEGRPEAPLYPLHH